jgi:hypothetical protein
MRADFLNPITVMPAKAGIQYPAASQLKLGRLWNTDRPV